VYSCINVLRILKQVDTDDQTTEMCLRCGKSIPLQRLRLHIDACGTDEVPH
jgi:RNA polymerase-binding transcription factor DksA